MNAPAQVEALDQVGLMRRSGVPFTTIGKKLEIPLAGVYRLAAEAAERRLAKAEQTIERMAREAEEKELDILRLEAQRAEALADLAERQVVTMENGLAKARAIAEQVARSHGLHFRDIASSSQAAPVVRARDEAVYRIAADTGLSQTAMGRLFGDRDHTTIHAAIRRHARLSGQPMPRRFIRTVKANIQDQNHAQH